MPSSALFSRLWSPPISTVKFFILSLTLITAARCQLQHPTGHAPDGIDLSTPAEALSNRSLRPPQKRLGDGCDTGNVSLQGPDCHALQAPTSRSPQDGFQEPTYDFFNALQVMQSEFFEVWVGAWPDAIEWTSAVLGTHVSAALYTLARLSDDTGPGITAESLNSGMEPNMQDPQPAENEIDRYFSQSIAYYFGENILEIMNQAYDDMQWVVLGWIESIKFMNYRNQAYMGNQTSGYSWHGKQFEPAFAHRANIFWNAASQGWDTKLCGGGMIWNPRLTPYKNAITNELYVSSSIAMYLNFKGDVIESPWLASSTGVIDDQPAQAYDPKYLNAAIDAYAWLNSSGMRNDQGLYTDGFHISGWSSNGSIGTGKCDERDNTTWTYNQGVVLTGLRGLWQSTANTAYLDDGHTLIRNVIAATGWANGAPNTPTWSGMGRNGILEERCDAAGSCSQDGQTFKGIFFHHLVTFCEPLPPEPAAPGKTFGASPELYQLHLQSCRQYTPWVDWNARAALRTRNELGVFGMWWGEPDAPPNGTAPVPGLRRVRKDARQEDKNPEKPSRGWMLTHAENKGIKDGNDRGRGRTVETQSGGLAVLRAQIEFERLG